MPRGRPALPAHLRKSDRRKSGKGLACGGVDDGEAIARAVAEVNQGRGSPLDTMMLSALATILLVRKRAGQAMPALWHFSEKRSPDPDIKAAMTRYRWAHEPAVEDDLQWQQARREMQEAGYSQAEIEHVQSEWNSTEGKGAMPDDRTIGRYLEVATLIAEKIHGV